MKSQCHEQVKSICGEWLVSDPSYFSASGERGIHPLPLPESFPTVPLGSRQVSALYADGVSVKSVGRPCANYSHETFVTGPPFTDALNGKILA